MTQRALILGGGGVAGIAWETGVLVGLADASLNLRSADLVIGTSAGSCVGAQFLSDLPLEDLFQRQVDPALQAKEIPAQLDFVAMAAKLAELRAAATNATDLLRRIGAQALAWQTVPQAARREVIASRLPSAQWPTRPLRVAAVDTASGERRVFDQSSGIDLLNAIAASCAVPLVWPPVTIGERRYMDGGVYSNENADLAAGYDVVLILTPTAPTGETLSVFPLEQQVADLQRNGAVVTIIHQDEATNAVIASVGGNLLDPSVRSAAAQAGREQGRRLATSLMSFWG